MDQITKLFLVMLLGSLLSGAFIVAFNPRYRPKQILKTNAHYFPQADSAPGIAPGVPHDSRAE
jgi:hypothetical protein